MTESTNCPDLEELAAWIDGEADETKRLRLARHVAECERCADVVEGVLAFNDELALVDDAQSHGDLVDPAEGQVRSVDSTHAADSPGPSDSGTDPLPKEPLPKMDLRFLIPARSRWPAIIATTLMLCVLAIGLKWNQAERAEQTLRADLALKWEALRQDLASIEKASASTQRSSGDPLDENELDTAKECRLSLTGPTRIPLDILVDCLDLIARDANEASQVVVGAHDFETWLSDPDESLRNSSCRVLDTAWRLLRGSVQEDLQSLRQSCRDQLETPDS